MRNFNTILLLGILSVFGFTQSISAQMNFVHPGIAFNQADLDQLKANITKEPWLSAYNAFKNDAHSQLSYGMKGPTATVTRAPDLNNNAWKNDMIAIHNLAFMYVFTGDSLYARKATNMLDAWAVTNVTWGGNESMLDIGDYANCWGTGAEILRHTFPGWTAANTQHVEKYFSEVLFPTSWVPFGLRDQNKGAIQLKIAFAASVFCNDITRFNQTVEVYRMDAGGGMRNSLPNGELGDTGRDDHWRVQAASLIWGAEVAWKQGVDMFAELDNRVLAIAELYHQYAFDGATMTYIPFGGYASYWLNWGIQPGTRRGDLTNIIYNAYNRRKGIPTPHTDRMRAALMQSGTSYYSPAGGDFLFLKSSDASTAVALPPVFYPSEHVQPVSNLTHIDIGNPGQTGSASFNNGIWTLKAAGTSTSNAFSFNFKKVSGDAGLVVKVNSVSPLSGGCGVMLRESLAPDSRFWDIFLKANGGVGPHGYPKAPWWLKIERVNTRMFAYHSQDGIHWTNISSWYSATGFPTELYAGFYTISGNTSTLNTATFSNVGYSQSAPTGSPEISSATTATATLGTPFTYTINASASPSAYSVSGLPAGLSLDAVTGIISGTPTELGQSEVAITATNGSGNGTATLILKVLNNQAPAAPTSAAATVVNTTQIELSWAASTNATSYSVKRSLTAGGPYTTIRAGITLTNFMDINPEPEVNNYYVITAFTSDMESGNSNEVFTSVPPAIPERPVATNQSDQISLTWDAANGASSYKVKRGTVSGGPYTTIATVSTTSYTDTNVVSTNPYYYVLSSVGATKESANSPETFGIPGATSSIWSPAPISNSLNLAANWTGNTLPVNPSVLTFNATTDSLLTNDINGLIASRIQFEAGANAYTISGNSINLKNDLVNNSSNTQTFTTPFVLTDQLNVNAGGTIVSNGEISGSGSLMKSGSGVLYVRGDGNNFSGNTTIVSGILSAGGTGTGTPGNPTTGPLGIGKILMNGGALHATADSTLDLYNDVEILSGNRSYMYEDVYSINLRGRLTGSGTLEHDGNYFGGLNFYGDNSEFTGKFISKMRSGAQRVRFHTPNAGSAKAYWLLDANAVDCHGIQFPTGTLHFGALDGRGYLRTNAGGSPIISIGALNIDTHFGGTFNGSMNIEKVGTGLFLIWGNHSYGGTTTVKDGKFFLNTHPASGVFYSPVTVEKGVFGGLGKGTCSVAVGTGNGPGAFLEPGNDGVGAVIIGDLTLKTDATYKAELDLGTATGDKVTVTSATLLNNPVLSVSSIAGTLPSGTEYTIIDNTGTSPISGTFKDLPEMSLVNTGGYNFRITYRGGTGNDIVLLDERSIPTAITSSLEETSLIGRPFSYTIVGIKSPTNFNASGLPAGLSIDTTTGVISGTPTEAGFYAVTLTISNEAGSDTETLSLKVLNTMVEGVLVASGDARNIVEWNSILDEFTYNVKRSTTSGGPYTTIGNATGTKFTDTDVSNGSTYYYVVSSIDSAGEYPNSTEVKATPNIGQLTYLKFDEQNGTRAIDYWGANHAALAATAVRDIGKYNQSLKLEGTADAYATLPTGVVSELTDFTISTWVKMDAKENWMRVFDFGTGTSTYMFLSIQAGSANTMRYAIKNGGSEQQVSFNYNLPLDTWTHFAVTQSGNTCTMYINGTAVAFNTNVSIKPMNIGVTNQNYLGKAQFNDPMFKGSIDDFKIYNRALSAAEIAGAFQSQTITLNSIEQKVMGDVDFDPGAISSSGLPVTYTSSDESVATIVNGKVHILGTGTTIITASQVGNSMYWPAPSQAKVLTVVITNNTQLSTLIGKPFTYTISDQPLTNFTATGLPAGLSFDNGTGIISGTPTEFGTFSVAITAANGNSTGSQIITLVVQNSVVSNVLVGAGDAKNILEWDAIEGVSFNIKRSTTSGGPYTIIGNTSATKFTDTAVSNGNIYYYVISSVDGTVENSSSTEVVATPNLGQLTYLKFDEQSGTRAIDYWGDNHAILAATATRDTGKYSQSLKLDGTSDAYATLPAGIVSTLNDFTISTWLRMDAKANWMRVFDFGTGTSKYMFLSIQAGSANIMRYTIKNGGSEQVVSYTYTLPLDTWIHFALTQSGNTCTMYINGMAVASNTNISIKPMTIGVTNQNYLGKAQFSSDPKFKGSIDEFKIYKRALSAAEIAGSMMSNQTITFSEPAQKEMGDADYSPAKATSDLPVAYTSSNTSVAAIVDGKVRIIAPGTSTITASQAGSSDYTAAPSIARVLTVVKKNQTITFAPITAKTLGDADYNIDATVSSGLAISFTSSNPSVAIIVNGQIRIVGTGTTTITASQPGNGIYNLAADVSQTLTVIAVLKLKYKDGDSNPTNNQIKPNLTIYNDGTDVIPYNELTIRYWLTPENYASINSWIDYAQLGNSKIKMNYVALPQPRDGAFGYMEYSFEPTAGNLLAGADSGQIQSRLANSNWYNLSESDDYSYTGTNVYAYNEHITMYRNGKLVWGIEPAIKPAVVNLKVYTETKSAAVANNISTCLKISNEGNVPVAYGDIKVRYWLTKEGMSSLNYFLDDAALGNSNIEYEFATLNPIQNGADSYLELGLKSSLGNFYPSSSTGNIQYRIAKKDWSNFDQSDDYSYNNNTIMGLNDKVTVYYQGQLIYGKEPSAITDGIISSEQKKSIGKDLIIDENRIVNVTVYPNPVINVLNVKVDEVHADAKLELYNALGMKIQSHPMSSTLHVMYLEGLPSGIYLLYVTNGNTITAKRIIKE